MRGVRRRNEKLTEYVRGDEDFVTDADDELDVDDERTVLDSLSGYGMAEEFQRLRAEVASRLEKALQKYEYTIKANFQNDFRLAAQRDPRIKAIVSEFTKEFEAIDTAEKNYLKADAVEHANRPWAVQQRLEHAKGRQNLEALGRDLPGGSRRSTGDPAGYGRTNDELVMGYPGQSNIFNDHEVWRRSGVARELGNRVLSSDGWMP